MAVAATGFEIAPDEIKSRSEMASLLNQIRKLIGNRRRNKRHAADLLVTVSVITGNASADIPRHTVALSGLTHDLSDSHLTINVPTISLGGRYLTAPDSRLAVVLDLPKEKIEFQGTAIRYEKQIVSGKGTSYLIVVNIKRITDSNRALYVDYLQTLD